MSTSATVGKGFVAGALSVVTIMSAAWWATRALGYIPANAPPLWVLEPSVAPFGVPRVVNFAFWGGVWGAVLNMLFRSAEGAAYWLAWIAAGAVAVAGTAIFVVPAIKGIPFVMPPLQRFMVSAFLNGMFGLGAAIWLTVLGRPQR